MFDMEASCGEGALQWGTCHRWNEHTSGPFTLQLGYIDRLPRWSLSINTAVEQMSFLNLTHFSSRLNPPYTAEWREQEILVKIGFPTKNMAVFALLYVNTEWLLLSLWGLRSFFHLSNFAKILPDWCTKKSVGGCKGSRHMSSLLESTVW